MMEENKQHFSVYVCLYFKKGKIVTQKFYAVYSTMNGQIYQKGFVKFHAGFFSWLSKRITVNSIQMKTLLENNQSCIKMLEIPNILTIFKSSVENNFFFFFFFFLSLL